MFEGLVPVGVQEGLGGVVLLGVCLWRWALSFPHARPSLSFFLSPHLLSVAYRSGCKLLATAPVPFPTMIIMDSSSQTAKKPPIKYFLL